MKNHELTSPPSGVTHIVEWVAIRRGFLAASAGYCLLTGVASADVLLEETFEGRPNGHLPDRGEVRQWRGPEAGAFGHIEVTDEMVAGNESRSARFVDIASERNKGPILIATWDGNELSSRAGIAVEWKTMVPVDGLYQALCFLGANWSDSPVIIIFQNGKMALEYGDGKREPLGDYGTGEWHSFRVVIHPEDKTFDLFLDTNKVAGGYPWRKVELADLGHLSILADTSDVDHGGDPVLYVDDIKVVTDSALHRQ